MSRIPKIGAIPPKLPGRDVQHQENNVKPPVESASKNNFAGFKRPSDDRLNIKVDSKKPKIESNVVKNKPLRSIQQSAMSDKTKRVALQPLPETGLIRSSMPAVVSSTKIKVPGKPKRPAWDLKGRIQDMEEHFVTSQEINITLKQAIEASNQRIAALETANSELHRDVEIKSVQSEEAETQLNELRNQLKKKTEEAESFKNKNEMLTENISNIKREYDQLKNLYQQETDALRSTITSLTSMKSGVEAQLAATKMLNETQQGEIIQLHGEINQLKNKCSSLNNCIETLEARLREEETVRRKLHNTVQELKGNIRVFCRMRPALPKEVQNGMVTANIVAVSDKAIEIQQLSDSGLNESGSKMQPKYEFSFDCFFPASTSQEHIFDEISQLVQSALDGYNVCIFAYGQTGSGKTFTMEGPADISDFVESKDHPQLGMIPRSVQQIFSTIKELESKGWKYKVETLFLEIYNERIKDLLNYQNGDTKCEIVRSGSKGNDCIISNVTTSEVTSCEQVYNLLKKARINRFVAATKCNEYSSRSHYVFQMKIYGENNITGEKCDGILNLVDLAGSERVKESESAGDRLTEAKAINKSLSNLGKVIMSLSKKENHIPYRDSKLTHLLANSLGGNSKTLMFVNISPDSKNLSETINSLRFATKVNQCNIGTAQKRMK